jgi:hypothetical protein
MTRIKKNIYLLKSDVKRWQVKRDEIISITVHKIIGEIITKHILDKAVFNLRMKELQSTEMSHFQISVSVISSKLKGLYCSQPCLAYVESSTLDCTIRNNYEYTITLIVSHFVLP